MISTRIVQFVPFFLLLGLCGTAGRSLPKYITRCKKHDPHMGQCIINAIEALRPYLKDGIPDMHVPKMEPMFIPSVKFESGSSFKASFQDTLIYGLTGFKINSLDFNLDVRKFVINLDLYNVRGESNYTINGKIGVLELDGAGKLNGSVDHAAAVAEGTAKIKNVKGKDHLDFNKIDIDLNLEGGHLYLGNLIKNNPELSEQTNKVIAASADEIWKELKPIVKTSFEDVILGLLRNIFERFPIDDLFADD